MTIGSTLADGRRRAGLSIEDVAAVTRIRPSMLKAMENDDFAMCGADSYARGHVRAIAQAIGLNPDEAVAEFDVGRVPEQFASMRTDFENGRRSFEEAPRNPSWNRMIGIAIVALLVVLLVSVIMKARG